MVDIFDFNGDGKTSFEENLFGTILVMGAFDQNTQIVDVDLLDDDDDEGEDFSYE